MNNDVEQSKVYIKQGEVTYLVVIALPKDALAAIKLSEVKVKSPTKKQENSSMRVTQISQYNALVLKEQREFRY
ncbi:hypothetical protein Cantr_06977 [Candida viswanathii]|uniref:Uncharacterized protein n=1 Tax=Candida viswanathii TaxID=5486 RepID=A0A367XZA4_9ASCO|nr:hypothetical protein Cantr_06977 [Candida viswanathii]